jgi:hypothetical protein
MSSVASALALVPNAAALDFVAPGSSLVKKVAYEGINELVEGATAFGVGLGVGFLYAHKRGTFIGDHAPKLIAGGGKVAAVLLGAFAPNFLGGVPGAMFGAAGDAALAVWGAQIGIEQGFKMQQLGAAVGKVLPNGSIAPDARLFGNVDMHEVLGEIPQAPAGRGLGRQECGALSKMV